MPLSQQNLETDTTDETTQLAIDEPDHNSPETTSTTEFAELNTTEIFADDNLTSTEMPSSSDTMILNDIHNAKAITPSSLKTELSNLNASLARIFSSTRNGRNFPVLQNSEHFPHLVKLILNNKKIDKLTLQHFADQMVTHLCHYGLSDSLLESLYNVGKIFQKHYEHQPNKLKLVALYFDYINKLNNTSGTIPTCLPNTNNVEAVTTTTLPTTQTPQTEPTLATAYFNVTEITSPLPLPTPSTTSTTDLIPLSPTTTQNSTLDEIFPATPPTITLNNPTPRLTPLLNNNLAELGLISASHGAAASIVRSATGMAINWLDSQAYLKAWRKPLAKVIASIINAAFLATLTLMVTNAESESEQMLSMFKKIVISALYSFVSSLILEGIQYSIHEGYSYFFGQEMSFESLGSIALNGLPLSANVSLLINQGYYFTEAVTLVGSNLAGASIGWSATQALTKLVSNKIRKNNLQDIESGNEKNNNLEMHSIKEEGLNETEIDIDNHFQNLVIKAFDSHDTSELDAFIYDKMSPFQIEKAGTLALVESANEALQEAENEIENLTKSANLAKENASKMALQNANQSISTLLSITQDEASKKTLQGIKINIDTALESFQLIEEAKTELSNLDIQIKEINNLLTRKDTTEKTKIERENQYKTLIEAKKSKKQNIESYIELRKKFIEDAEQALKSLDETNIQVKGILCELEVAKNPCSKEIITLQNNLNTIQANKKSLSEKEKQAKELDYNESKVQLFLLKNLILLTSENIEIGLFFYKYLISQKRLLPVHTNPQLADIFTFTSNENEKDETSNVKQTLNTNKLKERLGAFIYNLKLNNPSIKCFPNSVQKSNFEIINITYQV
jgi:hypothetical protein